MILTDVEVADLVRGVGLSYEHLHDAVFYAGELNVDASIDNAVAEVELAAALTEGALFFILRKVGVLDLEDNAERLLKSGWIFREELCAEASVSRILS